MSCQDLKPTTADLYLSSLSKVEGPSPRLSTIGNNVSNLEDPDTVTHNGKKKKKLQLRHTNHQVSKMKKRPTCIEEKKFQGTQHLTRTHFTLETPFR